MNQILDNALNALDNQFNAEAEKRRKDYEASKAKREKEEQLRKQRQDTITSFEQAVKSNKIKEVKETLAKDPSPRELVSSIHSAPSIEMARIIIDAFQEKYVAKQDKSSNLKDIIVDGIAKHPENAAKWDKLAKENNISYDFKTSDIDVYKKVIEAGFSHQCYLFEKVAEEYYKAKNGYTKEHLVKYNHSGPDDYEPQWHYNNPERAAQLKNDLITALAIGYRCDFSKRDTKSFLFVQELLKERELKEKGVDQSFVYRDPSEKFFDRESGKCKLAIGTLKTFFIDGNPEEFKMYSYSDRSTAEGFVKDGKFTGVVGGKNYYRQGSIVSKKVYEALEHVEDKRQKRQQSLEEKDTSEAIKKIGKVGINIDSKIQSVVAHIIPKAFERK